MSHYAVYDGHEYPQSGGHQRASARDPVDRYDGSPADVEVLAKVPDLDEAAERPTIALCRAEATPCGFLSALSIRSVATTATLMLLAGVAGFMWGRSGQSVANDDPESWRPPPPAASAPEAPVWTGGNLVGSEAPRVPPKLAVPDFPSRPPVASAPVASPRSPGAARTPTDDIPKSTPWSYPGTTANVPSASQDRIVDERGPALAAPTDSSAWTPTQTEANRGMKLGPPAAQANDYHGAEYRSGYSPNGYGVPSDPRLAARPEIQSLPPQTQYPTAPAPTRPQVIYPSAPSQPYYPNTPPAPSSTPYPAYPSQYPSTTPQ